MSQRQFNVLFLVAVAGSIFLLFAKKLGIEVDPSALTGFTAILAYVLTDRFKGDGSKHSTRHKKRSKDKDEPEGDE